MFVQAILLITASATLAGIAPARLHAQPFAERHIAAGLYRKLDKDF